jgi:Holliday junction resolvase
MEITGMPNTRYRSGVNLEREIRQILEERYNIPCLRTAGSKGDFDLVALGRRTILIQVKYTAKKNIYPPRALIHKLDLYVSDERWAAIITVQRQTRKTNLTWIDLDAYYDDDIIVKFPEAMEKLNQLCNG